MTATETLHPFDEALLQVPLEEQGDHDVQPDPLAARRVRGHTHPGYGNMVGPFGGMTAAQILQSVLRHPGLLGQPISLTVNFASALSDGPYSAEARPIRTNRSTQHWLILLSQTDMTGQQAIVATATAITALRRPTWRAQDIALPAVPEPNDVPLTQRAEATEWFRRYEMRMITGAFPERWDGSESDSLTQLWIRDAPVRALDFCGLTARADCFYPRIWRRRATPTPAGTVTFTCYYHAGVEELAATGTDYVLAQARVNGYAGGYFDQQAALWNRSGTLLVTSHQLVYFKQ